MPTFTAPKRKVMFTSGRAPSYDFRGAGLGYLLKEDGLKILQENGFGIVVEGNIYARLYTAPKRNVKFTAVRS